ncbi:unnamed protein product [Dicrocoelium dendriticum]|nr:unnamed protein product [Dicrocoelium dendriticum]
MSMILVFLALLLLGRTADSVTCYEGCGGPDWRMCLLAPKCVSCTYMEFLVDGRPTDFGRSCEQRPCSQIENHSDPSWKRLYCCTKDLCNASAKTAKHIVPSTFVSSK